MDRRTKLDAHAERNNKLLEIFREKRVDLDESRSIEVHFWAGGQQSSVRLAQELYRRGFIVLLLGPARNQQGRPDLWNVEAGTATTISRAVSEEFTESLTDLATTFEAEYDGWGTTI
jgi:regulator of RNase E activity RraB